MSVCINGIDEDGEHYWPPGQNQCQWCGAEQPKWVDPYAVENALRREVNQLRDKLNRAPHDEDCASVMHTGPVTRYGVAPCNCWKSKP